MLFLNLVRLVVVQFVVDVGYLSAVVAYLFLQGLVVGLQAFNSTVGSVDFRVLEDQLLGEGIDLSLKISLRIFEVRDSAAMGLVLLLNLEASLDLGLDLEALFFKVTDLLNQYSVLLGQHAMLCLQLIQVSLDSLVVSCQLCDVRLHLVALVLAANVSFDLLFIGLGEVLQLSLEWPQHEQFSLLVELDLLYLLDFPLLIGELLRKDLLFILENLEVLLCAE
mmetsp:Transcript_8430/g.12855  ORF Transcript_8430/g.12855 Transcript_8430/m.12855 type:complete len:222 (-) Transcript_8430:1759-2424(-)